MNINITRFLEENKEELITNYLEINSIAKAVRKLCIDSKIEYTESFRAVASKIINGESDLENFTSTETTQYEGVAVSTLSALKEDGKIMNIDEYCAYYQIPKDQVKTYKLVTHSSKGAYYNIASRDVKDLFNIEDFKEDLLKSISKISTLPKTVTRVLDTNGDGHLLVVDPADVHIQKLATVFETGDEYIHK